MMFGSKIKRSVSESSGLVVGAAVVVVAFVVMGAYLLRASHAATASVSAEPDNGTISAPSVTGSDATASGGSYVAFKAPAMKGVPAEDGRYVTIVGHTIGKILVLDPKGTWDENAPLWSWSANDSPEIQTAHKVWFSKPTDAKLVDGGQTLLVSANDGGTGVGGVAIIRVSDKKVLFYASGGLQTHSLEQLPDGNLVTVAASDNLLRVISTDPAVSHFPTNVVHSDIVKSQNVNLPHGAVWDPVTQRLWVDGNVGIDAYIYNFNRDNPKLTRDTTIPEIVLPDSAGGHDLYPILGQRKLFISSNNHMNIFDLTTRKISIITPDPQPSFMKAMGVNPAGQFLFNPYSTHIYFGTLGSTTITDRPLAHQLYKARWWMVTQL